MNKEEMILLEKMVEEVAGLTLGEISDVDAIWDKYYDKFIEMTVDENCGDKDTCDEEVIHGEMADLRVMYYEEVEVYSYRCSRCQKTLYGRSQEEKLCKECRN